MRARECAKVIAKKKVSQGHARASAMVSQAKKNPGVGSQGGGATKNPANRPKRAVQEGVKVSARVRS